MTNIVAGALGGSGASGNFGTDDTSMDAVQVGGGAAPAVGSGLLSGFGGSKTLSALQGGATAISMLGTLGAAQAKADSLRLQASQDMVNAQGATEAGFGKVTGLRGALLNTIGQRQAVAGAGGVDVGQGVAADTRTAITTANDYASKSALTSADIRNRSYQISSLNNQLAAKQAEDQGVLGALGSAFKFLVGAPATGVGIG